MRRTTVFLLALLAPTVAYAQSNPPSLPQFHPSSGATAPQQPPAAQAGPPSVVLPTVIVTAQKDASDVKEVPASVTAVTAETIADAGIRNVTEAGILAPNTVFTEFTARKVSNARFRGIGSSPGNPAITTYLDGVPQLNSNSSNIELLDVNQIEFVRGPQSPLFGRNTLGGIVNVTSTRPSMSRWTGSVIAPFQNAAGVEVRGNISGPLGDKAGDQFCRRQAAARRLHRELGDRQRPGLSRRHLCEGAAAVPADRELGSPVDLRARARSRRRLCARRPERHPDGAVPRDARLRGLHQPRHQQHHRQPARHRPELRDRKHHRLHRLGHRG